MTSATSLLLLLPLLLLATTTSGSPRFLALDQPRDTLGCSIDQLLKCADEINREFASGVLLRLHRVDNVLTWPPSLSEAMTDCGHLTTTEDILVCVNDILSATDCQVRPLWSVELSLTTLQVCLCDVLPFLC